MSRLSERQSISEGNAYPAVARPLQPAEAAVSPTGTELAGTFQEADHQAVGTVGSPSTTREITADLSANTSESTLLGDLVHFSHPLSDGTHLLALGTVSDIETRNRWHEDPNMRGVLKHHGTLPHLSAIGDTRTATVVVQAVYETDAATPPFARPAIESGGAMGMSPTTGTSVWRVSDQVVQALIARHAAEVAYLGSVYRTAIRLPIYVRDFSSEHTDGAFHTGIFGRSGSGKTALASYLLAAQMRHPSLGVIIFDPQGQWASQNAFPLDLQEFARRMGRRVGVLSIVEDIRLPKDAPLCLDLLDSTGFFTQLTVRQTQNREVARDEFVRLLQSIDHWEDLSAADLLRQLLSGMLADNNACQRIFNTTAPRNRFCAMLQDALDSNTSFANLLGIFAPVHSLFSQLRSNGQDRTRLRDALSYALGPPSGPAPVLIIDLSSRVGVTWLDDDDTKARLISKIASEVRLMAEIAWRDTGRPANCSVLFDEAHRFAPSHTESEQVSILAARLINYVRETRKYGLGWTFVTQDVSALAHAIYSQLRIRIFGYGLTSGANLIRIGEEVTHPAALELYKSFPDPRALSHPAYPFMLSGPISPLSFTSAPVFMQVFTSVRDFLEANSHLFQGTSASGLEI